SRVESGDQETAHPWVPGGAAMAVRPLWVSIVISRMAALVGSHAAIRFPSGDQTGEVMRPRMNPAPRMPLVASGTGVPPPTCTAMRRECDHADVVRLSVAVLK